jgi:hypothetical protein
LCAYSASMALLAPLMSRTTVTPSTLSSGSSS